MRRRWGLVLSGGGARGAFQVGVLERLLQDAEFGSGPVAISGTSAGGINAALLAAGKSPTEMRQFWRDVASDPPVVVNAQLFEDALRTIRDLIGEDSLDVFGGGPALRRFVQRAQNHVPPRLGSALALLTEYVLTSRFDLVGRFLSGLRHSALADTSRLRQRLVEAFGGETIPERASRCAINTVDVRTGRVVRYVTFATPLTREPDYHIVPAITVDMVLASASIPLLFPPVPVHDNLLWDGGLLVNTPLAPVVALGAEEIVTVLVTRTPSVASAKPLRNLGEAVECTVDSLLENAYNVDRKLLFARNRIARLEGGYRAVKLYKALRPEPEICSPGSYLDFRRVMLEKLAAAGRRAADAWLSAGPPEDDMPEPDAFDVTDVRLAQGSGSDA
jgi:NTE family protein